MKRIIALIRVSRLDDVMAALHDIGVTGLTVSEVRGHGRQKGQTETYRGAEHPAILVVKLKIEVVLEARHCDAAVAAIMKAAASGQVGDGKIFVSSVEHAVRIRTGETGPQAL